MNIASALLINSLTPLMLLSLAFAIAALVTALTCKSKRWIPIVCAIGFIVLVLLQLYLLTAQFYTVMGTMGMGNPKAVALVTWKFLSVVFVTPFMAPLALAGLTIAAFKRVPARIIAGATLFIALIATNTMTLRQYDWKLSVMLADGRGDREEKLWILQRDAYIETLQQGGVTVVPNEIEWNALPLPNETMIDIRRDDFFKDYPPPSMIKGLFTNSIDENSKHSSQLMDREIFDKHRAACEEQGQRLARKKLGSERKD